MANKKIEPVINKCAYCGIEFSVGGRGRPRKSQKYHNKRCKALARIVQPTIKTLSPEQAAYIAGLFDGEGSIIMYDRGRGGRPQSTYT